MFINHFLSPGRRGAGIYNPPDMFILHCGDERVLCQSDKSDGDNEEVGDDIIIW